MIVKLAIKINAVDIPDHNIMMHKGTRPSMGGLAIFIGVAAGFIYLQPVHEHLNAIIIGACIMLITGIIDDLFELRASYKLVRQHYAAHVVVSFGLII